MPTSITEAFYNLFCAATFMLLVGGAVYLFLTRRRLGPRRASISISRETLEQAERLSGEYRLSDLERILTELGAIGAWGAVVELGLTRIRDIAQMVLLGVNEVEFYSHTTGATPDYLERYRRSVEGAGLSLQEIGNVEVFYVKVAGSWPQIAAVLRRVISEVYGVDDHTEIELTVFD